MGVVGFGGLGCYVDGVGGVGCDWGVCGRCVGWLGGCLGVVAGWTRDGGDGWDWVLPWYDYCSIGILLRLAFRRPFPRLCR